MAEVLVFMLAEQVFNSDVYANPFHREPPRRRKRPLQAVAADVAPLLDRCGRLLADLAPHVSSLASMEGDEDDEEAEELGRGTTEAAGTVAEMSVSGSTSSAGQPGVAEPRTTGHR